jgi:hypothetical protein
MPESEAAPTAAETPPPEPEKKPEEVAWATEDDLPQDPWKDVVLPIKQKKVRVRYLAAWELTRLQLLPDLTHFGELMVKANELTRNAKANGKAKSKKKEDVDLGEVTAENYRYLSQIAHLAVIDHTKMGVLQDCRSCGFRHTVSLWSPERTGLLLPPDLDAIAAVALGQQLMDDVTPLSEGVTEPASPEPVATGT